MNQSKELPPADPRTTHPAAGVAAVHPVAGGMAVLHNRPFLLLWLAQLSTQVGGNMVMLGLLVLISSEYAGSKIAISALLLCFLLPPILFSAIAGVFVDRVDKRHMLLVTNVIRGLAFLAAYLVGANLILLYGLMTLVSTVTTFFGPAEASMIPRLVPREQLLAANGLFALTTNASFALGFALLGPFVVAVAGPAILILIVAAFYFLATIFCWALPSYKQEASLLSRQTLSASSRAVETAGHEAKGALGQLSEGLAYIRDHRNVGWTLSYVSITGALVGVIAVLGPDFARVSLGLGTNSLIVIILPLGAGIVVGIAALNSFGHILARRRVIEIGLIVLGLLLVLLSYVTPILRFFDDRLTAHGLMNITQIAPLVSLIVVIAFLAGVCYAAVAISAQTQLQEDLPEQVRGRVFGILNMLVSIASLAPIMIVGPAADLFGATTVLALVSALVALWGLISVLRRAVPHRSASHKKLPPSAA
jgi:MFS family permease